VETVSETRMRWEECSGDRLVEELKEIIRSKGVGLERVGGAAEVLHV
jgi:hypothetical protein